MVMTLPERGKSSVESKPKQPMNGRRRFIHRVGVAVPAVMAVQSAKATTTLNFKCLSPSANASIALLHSRPDREQGICNGRTPGYWVNAKCQHEADWAAAGQTGDGMYFDRIIGHTTVFSGLRIRHVMLMAGVSKNSSNNCPPSSPVPDVSGGDPDQLGAHLVAAYLNMRMGWVTVITWQNLKEMWDNQMSYVPTPGATPWSRSDIVNYLKTTMTL
jgi:hypothetical protein